MFFDYASAATGTKPKAKPHSRASTPANSLSELRLRLAIQYIGQEKQAIETVALRLGYSSLAAFSRAFKRVVGKSPGALREASQTPEEI